MSASSSSREALPPPAAAAAAAADEASEADVSTLPPLLDDAAGAGPALPSSRARLPPAASPDMTRSVIKGGNAVAFEMRKNRKARARRRGLAV